MDPTDTEITAALATMLHAAISNLGDNASDGTVDDVFKLFTANMVQVAEPDDIECQASFRNAYNFQCRDDKNKYGVTNGGADCTIMGKDTYVIFSTGRFPFDQL